MKDTQIEILVNGKPIKKYSHDGKIFIEAKEGSEYTIRLKNNTFARKNYVCSVDGINVVDGEAAGLSTAGYLLNGVSSYEIKGFRVSNDKVNAFKFSKKEKSYAAKSEQTNGDTSNCGVIGLRIYNEKFHPPVIKQRYFDSSLPHWESPVRFSYDTISHTNDGFSLGACESVNYASVSNWMEFDLGTQFSDKEITDKVTEVYFENGDIFSTDEIYYASREVLISLGVPLNKEPKIVFPNPFPGKFCRSPKS